MTMPSEKMGLDTMYNKHSTGMRFCFFENSAGLLATLAFCGIVPLCGCGIHRIPDDVGGTYICSADGVVDTLVLDTNGYSLQIITFTNGGKWIMHSAWTRYTETVQIYHFYHSFDFDPTNNGFRRVIPPQEGSEPLLWIQGNQLSLEEGSTLPRWTKQMNSTNQP